MKEFKFISVDDDDFNNSLCKLLIRRTLKIEEVETFTKGEKSLEHLVTNFKKIGKHEPTILFLDINMPTMDGWEFLEYFDKLDSEIKKNTRICILSSSIDSRDKIKAEADSNVYRYFTKPISSEKLLELMNDLK
jgi:CheY-like chemotaxis protein